MADNQDITRGQNEGILAAPNGQPSNLSPELYKFVRTPEFLQRNGDWMNGKSSLVLDGNGEPRIFWHGSAAKFDSFDLSRAGENTGISEYTDKETGEVVRSDSDAAVFFSTDREQAVAYGFLGWTNRLMERRDQVKLCLEALYSLRGNGKTIETFKALRDTDDELKAVLSEIDFDRPHPISSLPEETKTRLTEALKSRRDSLEGKYRNGFNIAVGSPISNRFNNFTRQKEYLDYFRANFDRLRHNDLTVHTERLQLEEKDFSSMMVHFFDGDNTGVTVSAEDGRIVLFLEPYKKVYADTLDDTQAEDILKRIEDGLNRGIDAFNETLRAAGYEQNTHLYPAFLKMAHPLEHDYKGSSFPDKYLSDERYLTAFIAAQQTAQAKDGGYDGVIYRNIRDPFLSDTYGVFDIGQIENITPSLLRKEDLSPRIEHYHSKTATESLENTTESIREPEGIQPILALIDRLQAAGENVRVPINPIHVEGEEFVAVSWHTSEGFDYYNLATRDGREDRNRNEESFIGHLLWADKEELNKMNLVDNEKENQLIQTIKDFLSKQDETKSRLSFKEKLDKKLHEGIIDGYGQSHDGWTRIWKGDKKNYVNEEGKLLTDRWLDEAQDFRNGRATVRRDGYEITVNTDGIVETVNKLISQGIRR